MKNKLGILWILVASLLVICPPVFAHHGTAAYDTDKKVILKGTVTRWIWSNPHCLIQLDVTDESGHVVHWITETENPSSMTRIGWTEKAMKVGDQITITAMPVKSGNPIGRIMEVELSNGQKLPGRIIPAADIKPDDSRKP